MHSDLPAQLHDSHHSSSFQHTLIAHSKKPPSLPHSSHSSIKTNTNPNIPFKLNLHPHLPCRYLLLLQYPFQDPLARKQSNSFPSTPIHYSRHSSNNSSKLHSSLPFIFVSLKASTAYFHSTITLPISLRFI